MPPIVACRTESYLCLTVWFRGKVGFKLHPVEPLHILLPICIHKRVEFAICNVIEHPSVRADVLHGFGQFDPDAWIAVRGDHISFGLALRAVYLSNERATKENPVRCVCCWFVLRIPRRFVRPTRKSKAISNFFRARRTAKA